MILTAILLHLFNIGILIITLLLAPISALITSLTPNIDTALASVVSLLETFSDTLSYTVSLTCLSPTALQFIVMFYTFNLIFPFSTYTIKLLVRWYKDIKP